MIKITAKNKYASVENLFEDSEQDRAFSYYNMLEEDGTWDEVNWISIPNVSAKDWIIKHTEDLNSEIVQIVKIEEDEDW